MVGKDVLRRFPLFADLSDDEMAMIAGIAEWEKCAAGQRLFGEGQVNGSLYGVIQGSLRINKMAQFDVEQTLCRIGAGEFFGEVGFINGGQHCASADAVEDTEVFRINRRDFDRLVEKEPVLGYKVTVRLAGQLSRLVREMDDQYLSLSSYVWGRGKRGVPSTARLRAMGITLSPGGR